MNFYIPDNFIWNVFSINFERLNIFVKDDLKLKNNWLSLNTLLIVKHKVTNDQIVVRVINTASLPNDLQKMSWLIDLFKDREKDDSIDLVTRKELSWTWYECRILWMIFEDENNKMKFGSDLSNIYATYTYEVYKPSWKELENLIKLSAGFDLNSEIKQSKLERYWIIRYSSSIQRKVTPFSDTPFYINPDDILARRTALFWMTRTWKSNSIKKLVQTVEKMNTEDRVIWQIIFDINWEYANTNDQDWTSIYEKYKDKVKRYSFWEKEWFEIMKIDFFDDQNGWLQEWFFLLKSLLEEKSSWADYFQAFLTIDLEKPEEYEFSKSIKTRYDRLIALYKVVLRKAWFTPDPKTELQFTGFQELDKQLWQIRWKGYCTYDEGEQWFTELWKQYNSLEHILDYKTSHCWKEWASEELKSLLTILTGSKVPGWDKTVSWYTKLTPYQEYHAIPKRGIDQLYYVKIIEDLSKWKLVIIDLSQGEWKVKQIYIDKLAKEIFYFNMKKFTNWEIPPNFQLYFEEAHNIFPQNSNDLTQIYNRLAKEGAKYNIWLVYATQELSAISPSILKNTENWFISHLNNDSELNLLKNYYDFWDYLKTLKQFSKGTDLWYSKIKMLSYPLTLPVQIDLFQ